MGIKFLVDESTGIRVARVLASMGFDVLSVTEIDPGASDRDVLNCALTYSRILVTNDKDFGELVYRQALPHAGVILLRLDHDDLERRLSFLRNAIEMLGNRLSGNFSVVTEKGIRLRRTPMR